MITAILAVIGFVSIGAYAWWSAQRVVEHNSATSAGLGMVIINPLVPMTYTNLIPGQHANGGDYGDILVTTTAGMTGDFGVQITNVTDTNGIETGLAHEMHICLWLDKNKDQMIGPADLIWTPSGIRTGMELYGEVNTWPTYDYYYPLSDMIAAGQMIFMRGISGTDVDLGFIRGDMYLPEDAGAGSMSDSLQFDINLQFTQSH